MKKYFVKIVAVSLIVVVFPMVSGFCFQVLFDSAVKTNVVQAAPNEMADNMDVCVERQGGGQIEEPMASMPITNHNNSLLPCCVNGSHSSAAAFSESLEINKFIPVIFFPEDQLLTAAPKTAVYHTHVTSPPELLSVKTTILRL